MGQPSLTTDRQKTFLNTSNLNLTAYGLNLWTNWKARIAKATKLLQTGEKRYNKRMADEKEKARQEEIRALKEKLESLENGE